MPLEERLAECLVYGSFSLTPTSHCAVRGNSLALDISPFLPESALALHGVHYPHSRPCKKHFPARGARRRPYKGSGQFRVHAELGMILIMPRPRSCRSVCSNEDVAIVLGVLARHDPEALQRCSTVR